MITCIDIAKSESRQHSRAEPSRLQKEYGCGSLKKCPHAPSNEFAFYLVPDSRIENDFLSQSISHNAPIGKTVIGV